MSDGHRRAFIIGIDRYGNKIPPLGSAVRDAQAIAGVLRDLHHYEIDLHLDEDATLEKLRAVFDGLPGKVGPDDRTIVYFAGHGVAESAGDADGPQGYFIPQDARRDDVKSFLPMAEVQKALGKLQCKHLLVLLDCCFAGAFKWSKTRGVPGRPMKKLTRERYDRYLREPARQVMTSASSNETALDVISGKVVGIRDFGEGHSPFAQAVLNALRDSKADVGFNGDPGDGVTTATELLLYIEDVMRRAESKLGGNVQKPMLWAIDDRGQGGEFVFETPGAKPELPSALALSEENNPYRGLQSYDEKDAALFFGRETLTGELAAKVAAQSMTLVVGASGSGKSSLVKAGLVHHLKQQTEKHWAILPPVRPGPSPMHAIDGALAAATRALAARVPGGEVLLIVDQLEELVTMATDGAARVSFFDALTRARAAGLRVICTLRADFEPHFLEICEQDPGARFPVRSMSREELREVIEGPARDSTLDFDPPSLVDTLIDEVHDSPGALPLLSFTLSELYRERLKRDATDRSLTGTDYAKLGGVSGALGTRANTIYDDQPDAAKKTMERVLLRLVSLRGGDASKRRVPRRELVSHDAAETARAEAIVTALSDARLVVLGRDEEAAGAADGRYLEAAHDKLVTGWRKLWEILSEHRENMPLLRSATTAAEEWEAAEDAERLWNADPRLPQLMALRKSDPLQFNELETRFMVRSDWRRHLRRIAVVVTVLAVIGALTALSGAALFFLWRSDQSLEAAEASAKVADMAEKVALRSRLIAEAGRPDQAVTQEQSLLLAVEAARRGQTLDSDTALRDAQDRTAATARILRFGQGVGVSGLAWSPGALGHRRIAAGGGGRSVLLWDAETGAELSRFAAESDVDQVSWSPVREQLLFHTGWWWSWSVLDTARAPLDEQASGDLPGTRMQNVEWSPDGKLALMVSTSRAMVWSADTEAPAGWVVPDDSKIAEGHLLPGGKQVLLCGTSAATKRGRAAVYAARASDQPPQQLEWSIVDGVAPMDHCAVSPDGKWYATTTTDGVDLWSHRSARPRHLDDAPAAVLAFDHRSAYLGAGTTVGTAETWNVATSNDRARLEGHQAGVVSLQWSADDEELLTASTDGTAIVWNQPLSTRVVVLSGNDGPLTAAAWDPWDAKRVATSGEDGTVRIFQLELSDPPAFGRREHNVVDATYDPSGSVVAIADREGVVTLRSADTTEELRHFGGGHDPIVTVSYCPDGATLVTSDAAGAVKLWAADSGALKQTMSGPADPDSRPSCSHDGRFIGAFDRTDAIVWEAASGARTVRGMDSSVLDPIWHPQKDVAAVLVWAFDAQVRLFGPELGAVARSLQGNVDGVYTAAWSHDGARLVTGDNGTEGGLDNGKIHLYDEVLETTGQARGSPSRDIPQPGNRKTYSLAWSPDDAFVVSGGTDSGRVWDTRSWTLRSVLGAPELTYVAWTPSTHGDRVVTVDRHGALRLYDPSDGTLVAAPSFEGRTVLRATFNRDGSRLLVLLTDHSARVVTVYQDDLEKQLCARAIRNFTQKEWAHYLGAEPYRATCENLPMDPAPAR